MRLFTTTQFKKDIRRAKRRGKNVDILWAVVDRLVSGLPLDPRNRPHRLSGEWSRCWECHIDPDWLLIWDSRDDASFVLVRTGSHADLFE